MMFFPSVVSGPHVPFVGGAVSAGGGVGVGGGAGTGPGGPGDP